MKREEILQAFDDINFVYNDCTKYDTLKRMLEELTEREHGEWIVHEPIHLHSICSCCGYYNAINPYYKYCPNCGAKMDEREEEDDRV